LQNNFRAILNPSQYLCIDESLILFKGRLYWKQYNPKKSAKFGIKTFSIVDCKTGFILFSIVYSGKGHIFENSTKDFGQGGAMVLELLTPYLEKFHHVFIDNWFVSPNLAFTLLQKNTFMTGTCRKGRKNMPPCKPKMQVAEVAAYHDKGVLVEYWRDKRVVTMVSTNVNHEMVNVTSKNTNVTKMKPKTVDFYNKYAGGVDSADQQMETYSVLRRTVKWYVSFYRPVFASQSSFKCNYFVCLHYRYKKLFSHLLEMCIFNAFRMKKSMEPSCKQTLLQFRLSLVAGILELTNVSSIVPRNPLIRNDGNHFPAKTPPTAKLQHARRQCVVCYAKTPKVVKYVSFWCELCKIALCPAPCFMLHHTK